VTRVVVAAALALGMAGCGDDPIEVRSTPSLHADYNRAALTAAIERYVAAGRSPEAYGELASELAALRGGMDQTVAEDAELHLTLLAEPAIAAVRERPIAEQTQRLAKTVWAVALAPRITMPAPDGWRSPAEAATAPRPEETPAGYVLRLCAGPFAVECRHVVPAWQGPVLGTVAIARLTQRVRTAVANCEACAGPQWRDAVARFEALDRQASADRRRFEALGAISRWPVAGPGAEVWPAEAPLIEIKEDGDWVLDGVVITTARRTAVLRDLREGSEVLGVHLEPTARVEALEAAAAAAAAAGFAELAIQARADVYPWEPRAYRVAAGHRRLGRATHTVQIHLRSRDVRTGERSRAEGSFGGMRRRGAGAP
jgi:hypothetical protein